MDWEQMQSNWKKVGGRLRARWGRLTDADLEAIAGRRDHLLDALRERYGLTELRAEAELGDWERHQDPIRPIAPAT